MFQLQFLVSIVTLSFITQSYSSMVQLSILQSHYHPKPNSLSISVIGFGAAGGGVEYDTVPIQKAINACSAAVSKYRRQCHVIFPPGKYLTATILLKSGVVLDIHRNATILGGPKLDDYPKEQSRWYVILAEDAVDVGIIGGGEINGQGLKFVQRLDEKKNVMVSWNRTGACLGDECRPRLVGFIRCRNIKVSDVRLIEPAYWWNVEEIAKLLWPSRWMKCNFIEAEGSSGGILVMWDIKIWDGVFVENGQYSITLKFESLQSSFTWFLTGVYAPHTRKEKLECWEELAAVKELCGGPWITCWDFNTVRFMAERRGCSRITNAMSDFSRWIEDMELHDPPLNGGMFSWFRVVNHRSAARLDRFLFSMEWEETFRNIRQRLLTRVTSDHSPIMLECDNWEKKR